MRQLQTATLSDQNITSDLLVSTYTADADRAILIRIVLDAVAGTGDYSAYLTLQQAGAGSAYKSHVCTVTAAAAVTAIMFPSILLPVNNTDIVKVYVKGLAGDTTTPDIITRIYELDYVRPTTAGAKLDIAATGEVGLNFDNIKAATGATTLTNITVPTTTAVTNTVAANLTQILGTALTQTGAQIAAAFKQFFDIATPTGTVNLIPAVTTVGNVTGAVGSVTGNVGGSVASVAGAVGSVTGAVGSVTGAVGSVTGAVGSVTAGVTLANDAITSAKFDESTAFPIKSADTGTTQIARVGADADTLETLSDQIDTIVVGVAPSAATIADAVWDEATSGHSTAGTTGKALATVAAAGIGATSTTITVNDGTNPLDGVEVWVTTDSGGSNVVASGVTNTSGQVIFMLDPGTYYCWKQLSGLNFTNPETLVVV